MGEKKKTLTKKEKDFCDGYIKWGSATKAYLEAYGCEYDTANAQGYKMLKKPHIREYITTLQKEAFAEAFITAERVALKLSDIAFADKEDEIYNINAQLKALDLLQKQLGLQKQQLEADVRSEININIE